MSLVENILSQISVQGSGGITKPQGFDLSDDTFEKLLQKGLNVQPVEAQNTISGNLGAPAGMLIEPFDPTEADKMSPIKPVSESSEPFEIKDVDMGNDYFSSLLHNAPNEHKSILGFAQKHAVGAYNTFGRNFIENLADFAADAAGMLK